MDDTNEAAGDTPAVERRWPELGMALFLLGLAALVMTDSVRLGAGWGDDGPRAGYFPFYIGLFLALAALAIGIGQLRRWGAAREVFATRAQLASVATLAVPMLVYGLALKWAGLYLCSAALIAWFMLRHGKHHKGLVAAVAAGVPAAIWLTFERWFLVPLPKSALQGVLGF